MYNNNVEVSHQIILKQPKMLSKLQKLTQYLTQSRNAAYLSNYQESQRLLKIALETVRQQMILNNFNRRDTQVWKMLQKNIIDEKLAVQEVVEMLAQFNHHPPGKQPHREVHRQNYCGQHVQIRNKSHSKPTRQGTSANKSSYKGFKDVDIWQPISDKKTPQTVKRVGKNITQAQPPMPSKSRTIESSGNKRKVQPNKMQKKSFLQYMSANGNLPDKALVEMLERDVLDRSPKVAFEDIADLETAKGLLQEAVLLPLKMPQFFTGIRRAWKGVLMFGPPGTGKTLLAKAVASSGGTTFFNVSASSLASKWKGQSQKLVRILFQMAKYYAPSVIFFDEIDALGGKRKDGEDESNRKVKTELLVQMDGATSSENDQNKFVIVLAATNRPWDLDEALRRRLQKRIYIPLPTSAGRKELVKINLKNITMEEGLDLDFVVQRTEGYSGADITNVCREAAYMPMRRMLKKAGGLKNIENIRKFEQEVNVPLRKEDFLEALKNVNKSVGREDIRKYEHWMSEFGTV